MGLKIFSDPRYLPTGMKHDAILYPFWGEPLGNRDRLWDKGFANYIQTAPNFLEMAPLAAADLAILPCEWEPVIGKPAQTALLEFITLAQQSGIPVASFFYGDCSHHRLPMQTEYRFRHSLYQSTRRPGDYAVPTFSGDLLKAHLGGQVVIRPKQTQPSVGFCGYAAPWGVKTTVKLLLHGYRQHLTPKPGQIPRYHIGHVLRRVAIDRMAKSAKLQTDFILRDNTCMQHDVDHHQKLRAEFVQNMVENDYIFCCRGSGNYSYRLYEALCFGRIPVLLNTDCVLPFDFTIDWKRYCVWVEEADLPNIANKIREFHDRLSAEEFASLQRSCRQLWEQFLSPEGFFSNLHRHLSAVPRPETALA
jgi:hypothetical protein